MHTRQIESGKIRLSFVLMLIGNSARTWTKVSDDRPLANLDVSRPYVSLFIIDCFRSIFRKYYMNSFVGLFNLFRQLEMKFYQTLRTLTRFACEA